MRHYSKRHRFLIGKRIDEEVITDEDPMDGVANLFDIGLVFIVGLVLTLFSAYRLQDLFSDTSRFTMLKQGQDGQMELITKDAKEIRAMKITAEQAKGMGTRLGTAYRLQDGSMVYVPENP